MFPLAVLGRDEHEVVEDVRLRSSRMPRGPDFALSFDLAEVGASSSLLLVGDEESDEESDEGSGPSMDGPSDVDDPDDEDRDSMDIGVC